MPEFIDRTAQLSELYGLQFPKELFLLAKFAQQVKPADPRRAFGEFGITLVGPFDVLFGALDQRDKPALPMCLHWRYYLDPPEFFTVLRGDTDGLHWGYWFDAPQELPPTVCSYYTNDAYEIVDHGPSLFGALEQEVGAQIESSEEYRADDPDQAEYYNASIAAGEALQSKIQAFVSECGLVIDEVKRAPLTPTFDGMGLVLPAGAATRDSQMLYHRADQGDGATMLEWAYAALGRGNTAEALQIARAVWTMHGSIQQHGEAAEACAQAYELLDRPVLANVCREHGLYRNLADVDLLQ